ncbi:MAG: H-NS histone family protein [Nevskia sp.]|nr:H-NS histone family protein [Nevskia sp.]
MSEYIAVKKQIAELQKKLEAIKAQETQAAIDQCKKLIADFELTAAQLGFGSPKATKATKPVKKVVAVKYADEKGNTWTGRGRSPAWISEAAAAGISRDTFLQS